MQREYERACQEAGLPIKRRKSVQPTSDGVECVGMEVHGVDLTVGLAPAKLHALCLRTKALLQVGSASGPRVGMARLATGIGRFSPGGPLLPSSMPFTGSSRLQGHEFSRFGRRWRGNCASRYPWRLCFSRPWTRPGSRGHWQLMPRNSGREWSLQRSPRAPCKPFLRSSPLTPPSWTGRSRPSSMGYHGPPLWRALGQGSSTSMSSRRERY